MATIIYNELIENDQFTGRESSYVYNALDCSVTYEIYESLISQLDDTARKTYEFSLALTAPVLDMSMRGLLVDQHRRLEVLDGYRAQMQVLEDSLNEIVRDGIGVDGFKWTSPTALSRLLYNVLKIPPVTKRNANGKYTPTTDRDALEKLQSYLIAEPLCNHLLALRDLDKKRQFLEAEIDPDGRMRTSFNIAGTNTGRLASSMSDFATGGNLQNVDRELRSVFIADPGYKFCNLDLEQGDSRNVGALCWNLFVESHGPDFAGSYLDACESGDLHTTVSRMAYPHLPWTGDLRQDKATAEQIAYRQDSYRQLSKKLGHGSNYGGSPPTMAKHARIPTTAAKLFQHNYFSAFQCIPEYHKWVRQQLSSPGYITTPFGRRRFFFGRESDASTLREAVAYSPQSMTAEEINYGMLNIWRSNRVQLLVQVHDSILVQYREEDEDEIVPWLLENLKTRLVLARGREFIVPTEAKIGWNWGDFDHKNPDKNPDGLMKWKGGDSRKRTGKNRKLSVIRR